MAYFWETSGSIPKGHGFSLFDGTHLFWLFLCLAAAVIVPYTYRKCSASGRRRYRRVMALLILADELGKWIMLFSTGLFTKNYLPFQLCTINIFIILIHMVLPKKVIADFLYAVCLPGALLAIVCPSWTKLPLLNFMHIHSSTIHILLFLYPLMLVAAGEVSPRFRDAWKYLLILLALAGPAVIANLTLGTNYMFLAEPDAAILPIFEKLFGNHLIGFPILLAVLWGCLFTPFEILRARRRSAEDKKKNQKEDSACDRVSV